MAVDQLAELARDHLLLVVLGIPVEAEGLEGLVCLVEDAAAGGFIHAPALHSDQPVFHHVREADAVLSAEPVQLLNSSTPPIF